MEQGVRKGRQNSGEMNQYQPTLFRRGRHQQGTSLKMIRTLIFAACLVPSVAMANGNTLIMTGATYDSNGGRFGNGGLTGGSGISSAGACYTTAIAARAQAVGQLAPGNSASKSVWFKTSSAPSTTTPIFSDSVSGLGISPAGTPVYTLLGSSVTLATNSSNTIADGAWHHLEIDVVPNPSLPAGGPASAYPTIATYFLDGVGANNGNPLVVTAPMAASYSALQQVQTTVNAAAGEVSEATCWTPYLHAYNMLPEPFPTSSGALLADWNFSGNGADSATATASATANW